MIINKFLVGNLKKDILKVQSLQTDSLTVHNTLYLENKTPIFSEQNALRSYLSTLPTCIESSPLSHPPPKKDTYLLQGIQNKASCFLFS